MKVADKREREEARAAKNRRKHVLWRVFGTIPTATVKLLVGESASCVMHFFVGTILTISNAYREL
jgi:hypothetical protein